MLADGRIERATSCSCAGSTARISTCAFDATSALSKTTATPRALRSFACQAAGAHQDGRRQDASVEQRACATTPPIVPPPMMPTVTVVGAATREPSGSIRPAATRWQQLGEEDALEGERLLEIPQTVVDRLKVRIGHAQKAGERRGGEWRRRGGDG